jgi:ABC-2 type transporter
MGALFVSSLFLGISNAMTIQPVVDVERTVFYRERAANMYSVLPYTIAQVPICLSIGGIGPPWTHAQQCIWELVLSIHRRHWPAMHPCPAVHLGTNSR